MDKEKTCDYIVWQLPFKTRWWDAPLALRNLAEILNLKSSRKSSPVIMKISTVYNKILTCHHKTRLVIMKISTVHNKILTCHHGTRPAIKKSSNCNYENLELSSWKSQPFIIKSRSDIAKISNCHHKNLVLFTIKSQLLVKMPFHSYYIVTVTL